MLVISRNTHVAEAKIHKKQGFFYFHREESDLFPKICVKLNREASICQEIGYPFEYIKNKSAAY